MIHEFTPIVARIDSASELITVDAETMYGIVILLSASFGALDLHTKTNIVSTLFVTQAKTSRIMGGLEALREVAKRLAKEEGL